MDSDPYQVFGPPGSGSISQRRIRIRIPPFSQKGVDRTEIMLTNNNFNQKKITFLRLKIMCLRVSYMKNI
jgi:hypothetical protein